MTPQTPLDAMFQMQRMTIEQSRQLFAQGTGLQRTADRMGQTMLKSQEVLQRQQLELTRELAHTTLELTNVMAGAEQPSQHRTIEETFDRLAESHASLFETVEREFDRTRSSVDEFTASSIDVVDEGTGEFLETHQEIQEQSTTGFQEYVDQFGEQLERMEEFRSTLESQFADQSERTEELLQRQTEQLEQFQKQFETIVHEVDQEVEPRHTEGQEVGSPHAEGQEIEIEARGEADRLEVIDGLGETFRTRLEDAGISTIDDLAGADPEHVAEAADVSENRAEDWIEQIQA